MAYVRTYDTPCVYIIIYRDDMGLGKTIQCISLLWSVYM